jgi:hypothetical protein
MYQFAHIQWAARVRSKKQSSVEQNGMKTRDVGWSAQDLADEAERMPHACEHVESPQPPTLVYGALSRNRRNFRHPSSSPATSASRSIILPSLWKV